MRSRVTIQDHLTGRDHVSTWCVTRAEGVHGAICAAFVKAFGSSAGRIDYLGSGVYYARGMHVAVEQISDSPVLLPRAVAKEERERTHGRRAAA